MKSLMVAAVAGLGALVVGAEAHAEEPPTANPCTQTSERTVTPAPAPPRRPLRHWYGAETLMSDGISILTAPLIVGFGGYLFAAPITHLFHRGPTHALSSFGLRLLLPVVTSNVGWVIGSGGGDRSSRGLGGGALGGFIGFGVGAALAIFVDASVMAYEPVDQDAPRRQGKARGATFTPMGGPRSDGGFDVGVGGRF